MVSAEVEHLQTENAELKRRIDLAHEEISQLREQALQRRREVRDLVESLPVAMSRRALLLGMLHDARGHPDKKGVVLRAARKLGRAPRKAIRIVVRRLR